MIGKILKIAAWFMMIFSIIGSIVIGVDLGYTFEGFYWIIPVGILSSIVIGLLMLGFGELIEKATEIADNTRPFLAPKNTTYVPESFEQHERGTKNSVYKEDFNTQKENNLENNKFGNNVYNGMDYEMVNIESNSKKTAVRLQSNTPGVTICSNCGREQHTDKNKCWYCDAIFEENNKQ